MAGTMDDMYLIDISKSGLQYCLNRIRDFCAGLKIIINMEKTKIVKLKDGVPFPKGRYKLPESGKILRLPGR